MRAYTRSWEILKTKKKLQLRIKNPRVKTVLDMIKKEKCMDGEGKKYKLCIHKQVIGEETIVFLSLKKLLSLSDIEFLT